MNTILRVIIIVVVLYVLLELRNRRERPAIQRIEEAYAEVLEGRFEKDPVQRRRFVRALARYAFNAENPTQLKIAFGQLQTTARRVSSERDRHACMLIQGACLEGMEQYADALKCYEAVCNEEPDFATAHIYRAQLLKAANEPACIEAYETVLRLRPDDAVQYNNFAGALIRLEQPQRAVELLEKALSLNPELNAARGLLAVAYARMGDSEHAEQAFDDAVKHGADAEALREVMNE